MSQKTNSIKEDVGYDKESEPMLVTSSGSRQQSATIGTCKTNVLLCESTYTKGEEGLFTSTDSYNTPRVTEEWSVKPQTSPHVDNFNRPVHFKSDGESDELPINANCKKSIKPKYFQVIEKYENKYSIKKKNKSQKSCKKKNRNKMVLGPVFESRFVHLSDQKEGLKAEKENSCEQKEDKKSTFKALVSFDPKVHIIERLVLDHSKITESSYVKDSPGVLEKTPGETCSLKNPEEKIDGSMLQNVSVTNKGSDKIQKLTGFESIKTNPLIHSTTIPNSAISSVSQTSMAENVSIIVTGQDSSTSVSHSVKYASHNSAAEYGRSNNTGNLGKMPEYYDRLGIAFGQGKKFLKKSQGESDDAFDTEKVVYSCKVKNTNLCFLDIEDDMNSPRECVHDRNSGSTGGKPENQNAERAAKTVNEPVIGLCKDLSKMGKSIEKNEAVSAEKMDYTPECGDKSLQHKMDSIVEKKPHEFVYKPIGSILKKSNGQSFADWKIPVFKRPRSENSDQVNASEESGQWVKINKTQGISCQEDRSDMNKPTTQNEFNKNTKGNELSDDNTFDTSKGLKVKVNSEHGLVDNSIVIAPGIDGKEAEVDSPEIDSYSEGEVINGYSDRMKQGYGGFKNCEEEVGTAMSLEVHRSRGRWTEKVSREQLNPEIVTARFNHPEADNATHGRHGGEKSKTHANFDAEMTTSDGCQGEVKTSTSDHCGYPYPQKNTRYDHVRMETTETQDLNQTVSTRDSDLSVKSKAKQDISLWRCDKNSKEQDGRDVNVVLSDRMSERITEGEAHKKSIESQDIQNWHGQKAGVLEQFHCEEGRDDGEMLSTLEERSWDTDMKLDNDNNTCSTVDSLNCETC